MRTNPLVAIHPAKTRGPTASTIPLISARTTLNLSVTGADFIVHSPEGETSIHLPMMGKHNVANALAAFASARALGIARPDIQRGLQNLPHDSGPGRTHTKQARHHHLAGLRPHSRCAGASFVGDARTHKRKILTVLGCGGDRDPANAPRWGAASVGSDHVYITSDNPRSDFDSIIGDIVPGVVGTYTIEVDRKSAIYRAIREAQPGDIVLIAGKGHETTQTTAGRTIRFDDRQVALEAVEVGA